MERRIVLAVLLVSVLLFAVACGSKVEKDIKYKLLVHTEGEGEVEPCIGEFPRGTLTFSIQAAEGWVFHEWEGKHAKELVQKSGKWAIIIDGDKTLTAVFKPMRYSLDITLVGEGQVLETLIKEPELVDYPYEALVMLEAVPAEGWEFQNWQGDLEGTEKIVHLEMDGDKDITAIFVEAITKHDLRVDIIGEGNVEPNTGSFAEGSKIDFTLEAASGWFFSGWEGEDSTGIIEEGGQWSILMDGEKNLTAVFARKNYSLEITIEGQGTVEEKVLSSSEYPFETLVQLTAIAAPAWEFIGWSGDIEGTDPLVELEIDSPKAVQASFQQKYFKIDLTIEGEGTVEEELLGASEDGYPLDSLVRLWAKPASGWEFQEWQGDAEGEDPIFNIKLDGDKEVTAIFTMKTFTLDIEVVGGGKVEEELSKTNKYPYLTKVKLNALADEGWIFQEWQGDLLGQEPQVELTMDSNKKVKAIFTRAGFSLNIVIEGQGIVEEKLMQEEDKDYPFESIVRLWAKPASGWQFKEWQGDAEGTDPIAHIEMDANKEVFAIFIKTDQSYTLDVYVEGQGKVEEALQSSSEYPYASVVALTALAAEGWTFQEWQGDVESTELAIEIFMDDDKEVTAVFVEEKDDGGDDDEQHYTLNVLVKGQGKVDERLIQATDYLAGSIVELKAVPKSGWRFAEWSGDLSGNKTLMQITLDADKEVLATFVEIDDENPSPGTSAISGQISLNHEWPSPYKELEGTQASYRRDIGKLKILDMAQERPVYESKEGWVPGQLLVAFKEGYMLANEELSILDSLGLNILLELSPINTYLVEAPAVLDELSMQEEIRRIEGQVLALTNSLSYVEANHYAYSLSTKLPNDARFPLQWHYRQIRLPQAWAVTTGSKDVRVAVLDTGIDTGHPDLKENIELGSGYNFTNNSKNVLDNMGHGTHCAGTIGADTNNGANVSGVMWETTIIPIKVLNDKGGGDMANIARGVLYAAGLGEGALNNPAQVISMSLGAQQANASLKNACEKASQAGVIIVAAAGNDSNKPILYPAAHDSVICVGATDYNYPNTPQRAPYSNSGPQMDVVAPGGNTKVDTDKNDYNDGVLSTSFKVENNQRVYYNQFLQGTSMATPHVAGVVGLMLANGIPASEIRTTLRRTAMDLGTPGFDNQYGHGLINAYWAVNDVREIRILVGTKSGQTINAVAEGKVDLESKSYSLSNIPDGQYKVFAWIDVQGTGTVDPGDYFYESNLIDFTGENQKIDLPLKEIIN